MDLLVFLRRDAGAGGPAIGLGWLIALAIGGAVVLFTGIGLLLAWRVKIRNLRESTSAKTLSPMTDTSEEHQKPKSPNRLKKRQFLSRSRSSGRLSISYPPVLPPLPSCNSLGFFSAPPSRHRSKSWIEEDKFHGPKINRINRESWFCRDSWFGRVPTLPSLELDDAEKGQVEHEMLRQSVTTEITVSQTVQMLPVAKQDDLARGRIRVPAQAHMRPSITDSELRGILWNTEQRLRTGSKSASPTKTPRSSPVKASPSKTPKSYKSVASSVRTDGTVRIQRITSSPSKRATIHMQLPYTSSRQASFSSVGSADNSFIAEATQELEQPGGLSSPSKGKGQQWQRDDNKLPEEERSRSKSLDSDHSSTLSTLYSVGEPEEKRSEPSENDPFIEKDPARNSSWEGKPLFGPRSLKRRPYTTITSSSPTKNTERQSHFRGTSVSTQAVGGPSLSIILQPPPPEQDYAEERTPRGERIALAFPVSDSATSMVTPSVTTATSDGEEDSLLGGSMRIRDTPKLEWLPPRNRASLILNPVSPSTVPSSPYDEGDMMSLLLSSGGPTLPEPPLHTSHVDEDVLPTPLSPIPQRILSQQVRQISDTTKSSSNYEADTSSDPGAVSTGSPSKRSTIRSLRDPPPHGSVGSAIVELRRMNSMVSSYSVTSLTSTVPTENDSPTLPILRGGGFATASTRSSRHNYLNLGTSPPKLRVSRVRSSARSNHPGLGIEIREDELDESPPNPSSSSIPMARRDLPQGLREGRRSSGNQGRASMVEGRPKLGTVGELRAEMQRKSAESVGLYDKEGFLRSSPML